MFKFCPYCGNKFSIPISDDGLCEVCKKHIYFNSKPTVTIIPLYKNREMLTSIRAFKSAKGKIDFIGGFLNNGEDPLVGAVRECKEETGLDINTKELVYLGVWIDEYETEGMNYFTLNLIYTLNLDEKIILQGRDDVESLVWLDIKKHKDFAFKWMDAGIDALLKTQT